MSIPFQIILKAARVNCGMTLKEACKHFHIDVQMLMKYEKDSTNIPRTFLIRIESVYKIPINYIYFGKESDFFLSLNNRLITVNNG